MATANRPPVTLQAPFGNGPSETSFNRTLQMIYEISEKTLSCDVATGSLVIFQVPIETPTDKQVLYNICSVRRTGFRKETGLKNARVYLSLGQLDFPTNDGEFEIPGDIPLVLLRSTLRKVETLSALEEMEVVEK